MIQVQTGFWVAPAQVNALWCRRGKGRKVWEVLARIDGETVFLGSFAALEEAQAFADQTGQAILNAKVRSGG